MLLVTRHAISRLRERMTGVADLFDMELSGLLRRVALQGDVVALSHVVGHRYIHAYVPGVGDVVVFVRPDRQDAKSEVVATTLTLDEVEGAGASDPSSFRGVLASRSLSLNQGVVHHG